ncbi:MAG TPA: protein kinase family protein [Kiritimatiellia bacterium]|nr:protein kinase family protein [Kiritimatiellia bacterium]HMP00745.1 protein kinase family protein [Kiritimatiellia bacterium]
MPIDCSKLPNEAQLVLKQYPEFQIGEFNDSGANGYVLVGMQAVLRKKVAIKVYFHSGSEMVHEPAIIAKINHANVLKVYDARKLTDNCSFFVMPAAGDGDLLSFLERYSLSHSLAHSLLCQLLSGVAALHAKPNMLVHRDLKPANLLVHDDSLLIADFGSVRKVAPDTGCAPASRHSILYRPPEAFGDNGYFDFSSDLYQIGLIGFLLFGGRISENLLDHLNDKQRSEVKRLEATADSFSVSQYIDSCLYDKIKRGRLIDLASLPCVVPKKIKTILRKAISYTSRYSTTCEFLADLNNARGSFPDWIVHSDKMELRNWNKRDYLLCREGDVFLAKKRKSGASKYQIDNSIGKSTAIEDVYATLKLKLKLK